MGITISQGCLALEEKSLIFYCCFGSTKVGPMGDLSSVNLPSRSFDAIAKKEAYFVVEDDKKLFVNNNIIHKEEKAKY